ncbi:ABC transporter substrate-binding protein [Bacillota bacterium Meth-B3]
MKTRRLLLVFLAVALIATMAPVGALASAPVKLTMVESLTSPARTATIRRLLDKFEAANPGITVDLISPPLDNADDKIAQMLMQQQPLDVLEVREQTATQFITNRFIQDMDARVANWASKDQLLKVAQDDITRIGGKAYLIPYGFYQRILFYNVKAFEAAGLKPPTTFAQLHDIGAKLVDPAKGKYGYSFRGGAGGQWYADMQIQAYTPSDIDANEAYFFADGSTIFGTPEALSALNDYVALYQDASPPDSLNWSYTEMVEAFVSGVTQILIQDPEVIAVCQERMPEGEWATAPLPVGPTGKSYGPMGYAGWGMTSYSQHPDEAWKLIEFLSSEESNLTFCKESGLLPIYASAAQDPFFGTGAYAPYMSMNAQPDVWICAVAPQQYQGWGAYMKRANDDLQRLLTGSMTAEQVLEGWNEYWVDQRANAKKAG